MKTLLVARLTLKKMIRSHYLIPVGLLTTLCVMFYLSKSQNPNRPIDAISSTSFSIFMITELLCFFGSIWLAISILPSELSAGHMRMNLTKPIQPISVLFGYFLGMFAYIAASSLFMAVMLSGAVGLKGGEVGFTLVAYIAHLLPIYGCYLAMANALVMLTNRPTAVFFMILLQSERFMHDWAYKAAGSTLPIYLKAPIELLGWVGYAISPPLTRFKISFGDFYAFSFPWSKYLLVLLYCASYIYIAHLIMSWALRRKEI